MSSLCKNHTSITSETGVVIDNTQVAEGTFHLRLTSDRLASNVKPGQFVMLRLPNRSDPLLGRPLAVYRASGSGAESGIIEVVYLVVGKMTSQLTEIGKNDKLEIWGPLGKGFDLEKYGNSGINTLVMVAGGIGQTPMLMLAERFKNPNAVNTAVLLYGARNKGRFCCVDDFSKLGVKVELATEDGSAGHRGFVTDLIPQICESAMKQKPDSKIQVVCCGPHPMLRAAFESAKRLNLPCDVSLETPMACGLGICFTCVVKVKNEIADENGDTWDYIRTCVDGPVFDAYKLSW
ncbi:MAG: dihydroorotate dehydrogenase electron transfer subunit [Thermoguttaceae bacterium]